MNTEKRIVKLNGKTSKQLEKMAEEMFAHTTGGRKALLDTDHQSIGSMWAFLENWRDDGFDIVQFGDDAELSFPTYVACRYCGKEYSANQRIWQWRHRDKCATKHDHWPPIPHQPLTVKQFRKLVQDPFIQRVLLFVKVAPDDQKFVPVSKNKAYKIYQGWDSDEMTTASRSGQDILIG